MKKPELENMWEMAIRIPESPQGIHLEVLRNKVMPVISILEKKCGVKWYSFLIHNKDNGVPISYSGLQFHIRFENSAKFKKEEIANLIPDYCEMLRKIEPKRIQEIAGVDIALLRDEDITEAWRIIGESCKWVIEVLSRHKSEFEIKKMAKQIYQFQHYISNITGIRFS